MSTSSPWLGKLKKLDYYTKTNTDVKKRSSLGGVFAIVVIIIMTSLFLWEFVEFMSPRTKDSLDVDVVREETIDIMFDFTFDRITCDDVTIDLLDESGAHFSAIGHNVIKKSLDSNGNELRTLIQDELSKAGNSEVKGEVLLHQAGYCHDCLKELPETSHENFLALKKKNAVPVCCNSCPALVILYQLLKLPTAQALQRMPCTHRTTDKKDVVEGEVGCRAAGTLKVKKIGGNFHVAAGKSGSQSHGTHTHHMHRVNFETLRSFNISHRIHKLHFGESFYGKVDPLSDVQVVEKELSQYTYYINVVPTVVVSASGRETPSHQYSYTVHRERVDLTSRSFKLPGLFFKYSFDALRMTKRVHPSSSFSHFLTRVCALIGGFYVVFGLLYRSLAATIDFAKKNK